VLAAVADQSSRRRRACQRDRRDRRHHAGIPPPGFGVGQLIVLLASSGSSRARWPRAACSANGIERRALAISVLLVVLTMWYLRSTCTHRCRGYGLYSRRGGGVGDGPFGVAMFAAWSVVAAYERLSSSPYRCGAALGSLEPLAREHIPEIARRAGPTVSLGSLCSPMREGGDRRAVGRCTVGHARSRRGFDVRVPASMALHRVVELSQRRRGQPASGDPAPPWYVPQPGEVGELRDEAADARQRLRRVELCGSRIPHTLLQLHQRAAIERLAPSATACCAATKVLADGSRPRHRGVTRSSTSNGLRAQQPAVPLGPQRLTRETAARSRFSAVVRSPRSFAAADVDCFATMTEWHRDGRPAGRGATVCDTALPEVTEG